MLYFRGENVSAHGWVGQGHYKLFPYSPEGRENRARKK
jgi:hypothetical protein